MRNYVRYAGLALLLLVAAGCHKKTAQLQSKAVPPDKTLFANAQEYLEKSQFMKARLSFQTLINAYPDSEFTPKAFFEIGNTYYKEGGTEALLQAEAQFKDFQLFYPTSELVPQAQFLIAAGQMRMMQEPERDPTHSRRAEDELKRFITKFPDSELTPVAKMFLGDVRENLAQSEFKIAEFYNSQKHYKASTGRYKQLVDQYPEFSRVDEAMLKLAQDLEKIDKVDEAALYYGKLVSEVPGSPKAEVAKERLKELNKPIPEVNPQLAALHQHPIPEDKGFSLLRPWHELVSAMGLTGRGDPYKDAMEMLKESQQAQASAAAAATAAAAAGPEAAKKPEGTEDIVISTTISKTADTPAKADTTVQDPTKNKKSVKKESKEPDKNKKPKG